MASAADVAAALLPHVSLLLTLLGGAAMAMAARLKWDPSIYIAVREFMPGEYRVLAGVLAAGGLALLLLAHLAAAAGSARRGTPRRTLLILYAVGMSSMLVAELALTAWAARRALDWLYSEEAQMIKEAMELRHDLHKLFQFLDKFHPMPDKIKGLVQEAQEDLPRNVYCVVTLAALGVLLQAVAVLLAALAARGAGHLPVYSAHSSETSLLRSGKTSPRPRLKTVYRNGRLEIV